MSDAVVKALQKKASLSAYQPTFREKASDVLRALLFSDDREGQRKAERLSNVLETVTPYGVATGIDDMREAAGQGDYATAGMMGAMAMVPGPSPKIKAYHGSPHSFDRFSMDKIGTGEGAQAYARGLYFAEAEPVALGYRDALRPGKGDGIEDTAARVLDSNNGDVEAAIADLRQRIDDANARNIPYEDVQKMMQAKNILNTAPHKAKGSMYEVEIDASPDTFLDWDKPLHEQSQQVRDALKNLDANVGGMSIKDRVETIEAAMSGDPRLAHILKDSRLNITGDMVYRGLSEAFANAGRDGFGSSMRAAYKTKGDKIASDKLRESGVSGTRYLDAGSRGGDGDGTRNYVVFDENLINIVRKYGIAGASAMLGYNLMDGVDPAQAKQLEQLEQVRKLDSIMGGAKAK